jgi:TIR domain
MSDLFISYSSHDRPWAKRLYDDLKRKYPDYEIFYDRTSIPPEADWQKALKENACKADNFVVLYSKFAKESEHVGPEIEAFDQSRQRAAAVSTRTLFYVPLDKNDRGPQQAVQGYPGMRDAKVYQPEAADLGIAGLAAEPAAQEWERIVNTIGDTIFSTKKTQAVQLAVLCTDLATMPLLEGVLDLRTVPGPTLNEFLAGIGLKFSDIKGRYGATAFDWRPFGTGPGKPTVLEFMEELRREANSALKAEYWFHWVTVDLSAKSRKAQRIEDLLDVLEKLSEGPSVLVIDPISLYNDPVSRIFSRLEGYSKRDQSLIVSLSPIDEPSADTIYRWLFSSAPLLQSYFRPQIPPSGTFARCGVNLHQGDRMDLERLVRGSLGLFSLKQRKDEGRAGISMGG